MIQIKFTLRMKQGMHSRECDSASHCIPSADISAKMMIRSNSPDLQKGWGKTYTMCHIQCGYHQFPYQTSARVLKFVPRVSLHLVLQFFLEMVKEFPVLEI